MQWRELLRRGFLRARWAGVCVALTSRVQAQASGKDWATRSGSSTIDYTTPRSEFTGFPILSGNSDFGIRFGAVGTLARFGEGIKPYRWRGALGLDAAVKGDEGLTLYAL